MHAADFAAARLREIKELVEEIEKQILEGFCPDHTKYREAAARRTALLEARSLIKDALDRSEAR